MILRADNRNIKCHRAILGCRCKFFNSLLLSDDAEVKKGVITFKALGEENGMKFSALQSFIRYLYTNDFEHVKDPADGLIILSNQEYLLLTQEVKHSPFLKHCQNLVNRGITIEYCLNLLQVTHKMRIKNLHEAVKKFVMANLLKIVSTQKDQLFKVGDILYDSILKSYLEVLEKEESKSV